MSLFFFFLNATNSVAGLFDTGPSNYKFYFDKQLPLKTEMLQAIEFILFRLKQGEHAKLRWQCLSSMVCLTF